MVTTLFAICRRQMFTCLIHFDHSAISSERPHPTQRIKKMLENQSIDKKRDQFVFDAAAEMALLAERPWEGSSLPSCCRAAPITISRVFVFLYLFVFVSLLSSLPSCCSRSKISPPKGEIGSDYDPNLFRIVQYGKKSWLRTQSNENTLESCHFISKPCCHQGKLSGLDFKYFLFGGKSFMLMGGKIEKKTYFFCMEA